MQYYLLPFVGIRNLAVLLKLIALYLMLGLPFHAIDLMGELSNLRPVHGLYPFFAIFFGPWGIWAAGLGNVIFDLLTVGLREEIFFGFLANAVMVYVFERVWFFGRFQRFSVGSVKDLVRYFLATLLSSATLIAILAPVIHGFYPAAPILEFVKALLLNSIVFSLMPGLAFCIILDTHRKLLDSDYALIDESLRRVRC